MARPPKPTLTLIEAADALREIREAGSKPSLERFAQAISDRRSGHYASPELRRSRAVSARWSVEQLQALALKHGETQTTGKLRDLIQWLDSRGNSEPRAIQDPERHQEAETSGQSARVTLPLEPVQGGKQEVAAGGKA